MKRSYHKTILAAMTLAAVALTTNSCGKKTQTDADDAEIIAIESIVEQNVNSKSHNISHVDSLAFMADDLTPSEATQVLATYMRIAAEAKTDGQTKLRLETMRKYVDVYDIVMSANGREMRDMFERLAHHSPDFNIIQTASDFRAELSDYADGSATEDGSYEEQRPDTTAARIDTISAPASEPAPDEFTVD